VARIRTCVGDWPGKTWRMHRVREDGYEISDDRARLDRDWVHWWLDERSYWAVGRTQEVQDRAIDHSLNFGVYSPDGEQVGYCRYVTDAATFAWMCDVFIAEAHRGIGLGEWMVGMSLEHPDLQHLRRHVLITSTAHDLYTKFGFDSVPAGDAHKWMIRLND
jgi:GNAT superfamily N-acetyltransferase